MEEAASRGGLCRTCQQVLFKPLADAARCRNLAPCILDDDADRVVGRVQLSSFGNGYLHGQIARYIRAGFAAFDFRNPTAARARTNDVFFAAQSLSRISQSTSTAQLKTDHRVANGRKRDPARDGSTDEGRGAVHKPPQLAKPPLARGKRRAPRRNRPSGTWKWAAHRNQPPSTELAKGWILGAYPGVRQLRTPSFGAQPEVCRVSSIAYSANRAASLRARPLRDRRRGRYLSTPKRKGPPTEAAANRLALPVWPALCRWQRPRPSKPCSVPPARHGRSGLMFALPLSCSGALARAGSWPIRGSAGTGHSARTYSRSCLPRMSAQSVKIHSTTIADFAGLQFLREWDHARLQKEPFRP